MANDQELYNAAIQLIETRLASSPWKTAAAVRLSDGDVLAGIGLANFNSAAGFCAEVGPLAQAYTEGRTVVASICVNRSDDREGDLVLAPCGICQERLAPWGPDVTVGVADTGVELGWSTRRLGDLMPYYWATALTPNERWPTQQEHAE